MGTSFILKDWGHEVPTRVRPPTLHRRDKRSTVKHVDLVTTCPRNRPGPRRGTLIGRGRTTPKSFSRFWETAGSRLILPLRTRSLRCPQPFSGRCDVSFPPPPLVQYVSHTPPRKMDLRAALRVGRRRGPNDETFPTPVSLLFSRVQDSRTGNFSKEGTVSPPLGTDGGRTDHRVRRGPSSVRPDLPPSPGHTEHTSRPLCYWNWYGRRVKSRPNLQKKQF